MEVFRISKCAFIEDLSGYGSYLFGGRWNSKHTYMLYTSITGSLAMLETLVHLPNHMLPLDLCMAHLKLPPNCTDTLDINVLDKNWQQYPAPSQLKIIGDKFIASKNNLALLVPSAIIPSENNILINPLHKDFKKIKVINKTTITIDKRIIK
jgi:RES domain-containing protein